MITQDTLWTRIKFKFYHLKLRIIFRLNENSGRVIPTNDKTRCIGKTRLLCEKAIENHIPIVVKYNQPLNHITKELHFLLKQQYPDLSYNEIMRKTEDLVCNISDIHFILGRFLINQEVYVDELVNTEDILMLKEQCGLKIKNGFYYNNNIKSPLETKRKCWWKT